MRSGLHGVSWSQLILRKVTIWRTLLVDCIPPFAETDTWRCPQVQRIVCSSPGLLLFSRLFVKMFRN